MSGIIGDTKVKVCDHSALSHMFNNPLCREQSLFRRLANIVFHVLTLGIPLAVYKLMSYCSPCFLGVTSSICRLFQRKTITSFSKIEQEALNRGKKLLVDHQYKIADLKELNLVRFPISEDVASLMKLHKMRYSDLLTFLKSRDPSTVWTDLDEELFECVDDALSLAFTAFVRMFEDVDEYMKKHNYRNKAEALISQRGYMSMVFHNCVLCYHNVRSNLHFKDDKVCLDDPAPIEKSKIFYQEGTVQNRWRLLYNEICERLRMHVSEEELNMYDTRFVSLSLKDESPEVYSRPVIRI